MIKRKKRGHDKVEIIHCELCEVDLPNKNAMGDHLLGQKHRKLYMEKEEKTRIEKKCGIFVKGFPPDITREAILNYFSQFGDIIWTHIGDNFALLDFTDPSAAEKAMKDTRYLGGKRLLIKYRQLRQQVQIKKPEDEDPSHIRNQLKDLPTFDDQVQKLIQCLQPDGHSQFPKYRHVCYDLFNALLPVFPHCQIHPFGSTITGLNLKNSDVDVFVSHVRNDNEDEVASLYIIKKLLANSRRFINIIVIRNAKIPILKCVHKETHISCDINLKNMLGVCNSRLINYFLSINPKLRQTMMVLKYWAKIHGISGQNNLFSNYALTMMFIFYLQQSYRLPSVLSLQQNPFFFNFQDGWNGGFEPIPVYSNSALTAAPLLKLLEGFFCFYSEFDYGVQVICPFLGVTVKKDAFLSPTTLPNAFHAYKSYVGFEKQLKIEATICVQDPFEHSRNTTPIVTNQILNVFVTLCRLGKKSCSRSSLYELLVPVPPESYPGLITNNSAQFFMPMRAGLKYIEENCSSLEQKQIAWLDSVVKFTTIVLKEFFKFKIVERNTPISNNKKRKRDDHSDVYQMKGLDDISFECSGNLNLWEGRKAMAKNVPTDVGGTVIEKEVAVTKQLCDQYKNLTESSDIINFEITIGFNDETTPGMNMKLKKVAAYKNTFKSFALFLSANLPTWFEMYEREQSSSVQKCNR